MWLPRRSVPARLFECATLHCKILIAQHWAVGVHLARDTAMDDTFGDNGSGSEDDEKESEAPSFYEKDCILFVIDARQAMLAEPAPGEPPPLTQALRAVAATMRKRVLAGDGVMLFDTREKSAPEGLQSFDHTFVLLPMAEPLTARHSLLWPLLHVAATERRGRRERASRADLLIVSAISIFAEQADAHVCTRVCSQPDPAAQRERSE